MSKTKRIVCYAINGAGMGHVSRLLAIAKWMRRYCMVLDERMPEIIFLTSSDASDMLAEAGFAAFKIPSKTTIQQAHLDKPEFKRLAKHFIWNTLGVFAPDLLVVDTFPSGSFDELFQLMDGPFRKSFIYRNVKPEYAERPTFRSALNLYDCIVVPHDSSRIGEQKNEWPPAIGAKLKFAGEVVQYEAEEFVEVATARAELGVADGQRIVYLSAGGGGDPQAEMNLKQLVGAARDLPQVHVLVGAGPLYRGEKISGPNITWYSDSGVGRYFRAVDCAISAGGYNTFHELIFARVPAAFFSQHKIADDQSDRIEQACRKGVCLRFDLDERTTNGEICDIISKLLTPKFSSSAKVAAQEFLPTSGAATCALQLLSPLYKPSQLDWCAQLVTPKLSAHVQRHANDPLALATWLNNLAPPNQLNCLAQDSRLQRLVGQLSTAAQIEITEALESSGESPDLSSLEDKLCRLLSFSNQCAVSSNENLEPDVQRTVVAAMKKQPLENELNREWLPWVCSVLSLIQLLVQRGFESHFGAQMWMSLYRAFPKIVDADLVESFELFDKYVQHHIDQENDSHAVLKAIQLLKLAHPRVTQDTILQKINRRISI